MHSNSLRTFLGFKALSALALLALLAPLGCGAAGGSADGEDDHGAPQSVVETAIPKVITARTFGTPPPAAAAAGGENLGTAVEALNSGHGIGYNGGHVMSGVVHVYYIWYGNWAGNTAPTILADLIGGLSGSPYYNINKLYDDSFGGQVSGAVQLVQTTTDAYSQGTSLSVAQIQAVVASALSSGRLPVDTNGVYFVLTSSDVTGTSADANGPTSFCANYCGWHTFGTIAGVSNIKYAFVGNGDRCPSSCRPFATSPNGNAGADGMANILAHELEETMTDPNLDAWTDPSNVENGDKCAWTFGAEYTVANGSSANMRLGSRDFHIQQNWVNDNGGYCALKPPSTNAQISCAFDWAQNQYPSLFSPPAPGVLLSSPPYMYRYFSATNSYLGAAWPSSTSTAKHIYYMSSGGGITDEGVSDYWTDMAHCF